MSRFYVENNDENTRDLFEKRNYYNSKLSKTGYQNVVDFRFGEKFMYGRVGRFFIPMILRTTPKRFKRVTAREAGMSAVNFVVDAFYDMAQQFDRCATYGSIDTSDPFLTNIKVHKAYQNPSNLYREHRVKYFGVITGLFRGRQLNVRNFDDFTDKLMPILQKTAKNNAFTKVGFIKSRRCPILSSGLAIEIADLDPSIDQDKIEQFVNSNNWNFYLNACASYGFMVDKNIPWRIVADIGNLPTRSPMMDYAEKYGFNSTNQILDGIYDQAHIRYFERFKTNILNLYNKVKLKNFLETEDCEGITVSRVVVPATYTFESFFSKYTDKHFLKLYFNIRVFEEETKMTQNEISLLLDDCIEIYMTDGTDAALAAFERIINKPFDKRGSLSYIKKYVDAVNDINER